MSARGLTSVTVFAAALVGSQGAAAQDPLAGDPDPFALEARVWLNRGADPVVRRGDRVRVYYRTAQDAYVGIFQIDTNGFVRLLFPRSPSDDHYVRGGRDYRLLFPDSPYWRVDENEGKGYLFVVAATTPLDFSAFSYSRYDGGWDLSSVAQNVYGDPYVAMDDFVTTVIPDWEYSGYALDFATYDVGRSHDYPRFLCYDCHGFQPFNSWNPYGYYCTNFRVVVYDDPYFYPTYRYSGTRVVYVRPPAPRQPMFVFKERGPGEPGTPVVQTRPVDRPGIPGDPLRRGVGSAGGVPPAGGVSGGGARPRPTAVVPARRTPAAGTDRRGQPPDAGASPRAIRSDPTRLAPRRPSEVLPSAPGGDPPGVRRSGGNRPERSPIQSPPADEQDRRPTLERRPDPRSGGVQRSTPGRVGPTSPSARPDRDGDRPATRAVPSTGGPPRTIRGRPPTRPPPQSRPTRPSAGSSPVVPRTQARPPTRPPPESRPARPSTGSGAATPRTQTPPPAQGARSRPRRRPPGAENPSLETE